VTCVICVICVTCVTRSTRRTRRIQIRDDALLCPQQVPLRSFKVDHSLLAHSRTRTRTRTLTLTLTPTPTHPSLATPKLFSTALLTSRSFSHSLTLHPDAVYTRARAPVFVACALAFSILKRKESGRTRGRQANSFNFTRSLCKSHTR
jgi:hypothetical protein